MSAHQPEIEQEIVSDTNEDLQEPPMYKVLLLNDDYTTMDFVVEILMYVFHKSIETATQIMLNVHRDGKGLCGVYTFDVAETKVLTVEALARERGFPLKCAMEKE
jgi:ATP-dependent Clp protease adaptor protein ClpS